MLTKKEKESKRLDFLIAMYNQMFSDINRHIIVTWQSVSVLVGTIALFSLVEKNIVPIDLAVSLVLIISIWQISHVYDSAYWYNRNLCIIANVERQFLLKSDLKDIHYYFGAHRPENKMITHLRIQLYLAVGVSLLVLLYHALEVTLPAIHGTSKWANANALPYLFATIGIVVWIRVWKLGKVRYAEFISNSPGRSIDASEVDYGIGHGHDST